ncbi:hypothetical protein OPIT5_04085 [Opitutaceae bacterium TAV5]|nr:hypothetical protein OPIT5_04085 [Opitutaceae bacterium TAV5]
MFARSPTRAAHGWMQYHNYKELEKACEECREQRERLFARLVRPLLTKIQIEYVREQWAAIDEDFPFRTRCPVLDAIGRDKGPE